MGGISINAQLACPMCLAAPQGLSHHEQCCICMRIAATTHVGLLQLSQEIEADSIGVVLVHFPSICMVGDRVYCTACAITFNRTVTCLGHRLLYALKQVGTHDF